MLHDFLDANRITVIERCRARVAHRLAPRPVPGELEHGVAALLGQVIDLLRLDHVADSTVKPRSAVALGAARFHADSLIAASAARHGHELLAYGLSIEQVVLGYGDLAQVVAEMAAESSEPLQPGVLGTLGRCLERATAEAVTAFCEQRDRLLAGADNRAMGERLGRVTEQLCGFSNDALLAFVAIKEGGVGLHGATGGVLERSLEGLNDLVSQVLVDVRLATGAAPRLDHFAAERLVEEARIVASFEPRSKAPRGIPEAGPNVLQRTDRAPGPD